MTQKLLLLGLQLTAYFSNRFAALWAFRIWASTRRYPEPQREKHWRLDAEVKIFEHQFGQSKRHTITTYHWGINDPSRPLILLIHGWNGRGLQLAGFVQPLLALGYQVLSFDAPGHGRSQGNKTNLIQVANIVAQLVKSVDAVDAIIGHSFGAMVMSKVLRDGLKVRTAVAISSPIDIHYLFNLYCEFIKISAQCKALLIELIKNRHGREIFTSASIVNNAKEFTIPALIVHDKHDREIPVAHAIQINQSWSGSKLILTEKLGHLRILRDQKLIASIVGFIDSSKLN